MKNDECRMKKNPVGAGAANKAWVLFPHPSFIVLDSAFSYVV
jgi:hypothetical protein